MVQYTSEKNYRYYDSLGDDNGPKAIYAYCNRWEGMEKLGEFVQHQRDLQFFTQRKYI